MSHVSCIYCKLFILFPRGYCILMGCNGPTTQSLKKQTNIRGANSSPFGKMHSFLPQRKGVGAGWGGLCKSLFFIFLLFRKNTFFYNATEFFLLLALLHIVGLNITDRLYVSLKQSLFRKNKHESWTVAPLLDHLFCFLATNLFLFLGHPQLAPLSILPFIITASAVMMTA